MALSRVAYNGWHTVLGTSFAMSLLRFDLDGEFERSALLQVLLQKKLQPARPFTLRCQSRQGGSSHITVQNPPWPSILIVNGSQHCDLLGVCLSTPTEQKLM